MKKEFRASLGKLDDWISGLLLGEPAFAGCMVAIGSSLIIYFICIP